MQIQTVTFDRIFSVSRQQSKLRRWTEFGFESNGTKVYTARVVGHPDLVSGVPLVLALARRDSWTNIFGWANLATGEIVVPARQVSDVVVSIVFAVAFNVLSVGPWMLNWPNLDAGKAFILVLASLAMNAILFSWGARAVRQLRAFRRLSETLTFAKSAASLKKHPPSS